MGWRAENRMTPKCVPANDSFRNSLKANGAEVAQLVEQPIRKPLSLYCAHCFSMSLAVFDGFQCAWLWVVVDVLGDEMGDKAMSSAYWRRQLFHRVLHDAQRVPSGMTQCN
jgi:hypothetical protein